MDNYRIAYISGPYRSSTPNGIYFNINQAREVAIKYWMRGYIVLTPHLNSMFMDGLIPDSEWIKRDLELLRRCDTVVMLKTWKNSQGSCIELDEAIRLNKEVIYE